MQHSFLRLALLCACLPASLPAAAEQALQLDVFASDDADDTSVLRTGLSWHPRFDDLER